MSDLPPFVWPCRHVRPSLLFVVERWAVVCENVTEYLSQPGLDWSRRQGYETPPGFGYTLLEDVRVGSKLEILQVCDGLQLNGEPVKSPSSETGWVWARHYFVKGWIPVRYLLPLDILSEAEVQLRILRDGSYISPPVPLRRTDSLGNLLLDLNDPDPEYRC